MTRGRRRASLDERAGHEDTRRSAADRDERADRAEREAGSLRAKILQLHALNKSTPHR